MIDKNLPPLLIQEMADNGEYSHFKLIDSHTGETLWLEQDNDMIIEEIFDEVKRATSKFPTWPTDPLHAKAVLNEEVGEVEKAILQTIYEPHKSNKDNVREEAIQMAAMSLRFLMSLDVYEYKPCKQHKQEPLK